MAQENRLGAFITILVFYLALATFAQAGANTVQAGTVVPEGVHSVPIVTWNPLSWVNFGAYFFLLQGLTIWGFPFGIAASIGLICDFILFYIGVHLIRGN